MPSVNGYVSAREWLAETREALGHAIECLGQIRCIIDDLKTEMANAPVPRGYRGYRLALAEGEKVSHLEDAEDDIIKAVEAIKAIDILALESRHIKEWEQWWAEAAEAYDRRHGR